MRRLILLLAILLALAGLSGFPVQGQEGGIVLVSREVRSQFPDGVLFEAVVETVAPAKIEEIKLEMGVKGSARASYAYLDFSPDTRAQGKYLLRTGGAQYKPPGTLIEYRFIIADSSGRILETEKGSFLYLDTRFQWAKAAEGMVEVYYYGPTRERADLILKASAGTVTKMGALLGVAPAQPIRVVGYNNALHLAPALPFQGKAVQTELQTQGQAWYEYGVLLMLLGDPRADGVASHEMTHMLVGEAMKGATVNLPAWLNEGLAEYGNINPGYSYDVVLSEAISSKRLLPLRHMQAMPGIPRDIMLFYGQARSVVKYLSDTYGEGKIKALFAAFKQGLPIDEALKKVYGLDQDGLDNAWRRTLGLPLLEPVPMLTPVPSPHAPFPPTEEPKEAKPPAKARGGFGCALPRTP